MLQQHRIEIPEKRQIRLCLLSIRSQKILPNTSIGGSVVEFSPATRETGVRFPANAYFYFLNIRTFTIANIFPQFK